MAEDCVTRDERKRLTLTRHGRRSTGIPITQNRETLKNSTPHILVGTPGRVLGLLREKTLKLDKVKHFVMDECDKMLEAVGA